MFDFGPELYIWAGKRACGDERKVGLALGRELWEEEYDYSECDINPITPMVPLSQAALKGTNLYFHRQDVKIVSLSIMFLLN